MPSIHTVANHLDNVTDNYRKEYLKKLSSITDRNVISYYSNFLSGNNLMNTDINNTDLHGFMSTIYRLNKTKGLDLLIHTPGGDPTALESIVSYLYSIFGRNIRAIVPHMAMSAGTMLACACKHIIMGKHSSLGPIDPQFGGIAAFDVIQEFDKAKKETSEDSRTGLYWNMLISKYPVGFYEKCLKSTELSSELVEKWLSDNMLKDVENKTARIELIIKHLNENKNSKTHSRHFNVQQCKEMGLEIIDLEDSSELQDIILTLHHCYMYTFNRESDISKIIENQDGIAVVSREE